MKAVLFDCDGLMFNTEYYAISIWKKVAEEYHFQLPDGFFETITGSGGPKVEEYFNSIHGIQQIRKIASEKRFDLQYWSSFPKDSLNKKGLLELYTYLKKNGYRIAVCSSSRQEYVRTLLSTVSIPLEFDAVVTGDMVKLAKPAPDIFLKGAALLGVAANECLVLEDSKQGLQAAKNAGMHSCWIKDMIQADEEMSENIEYTVEDLSQVISLLEKGM